MFSIFVQRLHNGHRRTNGGDVSERIPLQGMF